MWYRRLFSGQRHLVIFLVFTAVLVAFLIAWSYLPAAEADFAVQVDSYQRMEVSVFVEAWDGLTHWPRTAFNLLAPSIETKGPLSAALFVDAKTNKDYIDMGLKGGLSAKTLCLSSNRPLMVVSVLSPPSNIVIDIVEPSVAEQLGSARLVVAYEEFGMTTSPIFSGLNHLSIAGTSEGQPFHASGTEDLRNVGGEEIPCELLSGGLSSASWSVPPKNVLAAVDPLTLRLHPLAILVNVSSSEDEGHPGRLIVPSPYGSSLHLWSLDQARLRIRGVYGPVHVNGTTSYRLEPGEALDISTVAKSDPSQAWALAVDDSGIRLSGCASSLSVVRDEERTNLMPTRSGLRFTSTDFWIPLVIGIIVSYWFAQGVALLKKKSQNSQSSGQAQMKRKRKHK